MGLVVKSKDFNLLKLISERERAPMFNVGVAGSDHRLVFDNPEADNKPVDLYISDLFGKALANCT